MQCANDVFFFFEIILPLYQISNGMNIVIMDNDKKNFTEKRHGRGYTNNYKKKKKNKKRKTKEWKGELELGSRRSTIRARREREKNQESCNYESVGVGRGG
jgi:hypothetical protein